MTQHYLEGRSESELLWFQRRGFLQAAAAWSAVGGLSAAHAQARGNVVELRGDATVNGQPLGPLAGRVDPHPHHCRGHDLRHGVLRADEPCDDLVAFGGRWLWVQDR